MTILGYLRSGETVTGHNSYVSREVLTDALRRIESRGNQSIHLSVDMGIDIHGNPLPERIAFPVGRPMVVKVEEYDKPYVLQRLKGEDYFPFVERDENIRTNKVSLHMEKTEGGYHLKIACYGEFFERHAEHPFWGDHAFNLECTPHLTREVGKC